MPCQNLEEFEESEHKLKEAETVGKLKVLAFLLTDENALKRMSKEMSVILQDLTWNVMRNLADCFDWEHYHEPSSRAEIVEKHPSIKLTNC
ncbi:MAG: hypothetical protein ACE5Z5_11085 [Candidatus Bathyarchaeia archaeon]